MACMKLNKAIVFGCAGGSVGLAGLYLVNKSELSSFVMGGDGVTLNSIVLVSGAKAIPVIVTVSRKINPTFTQNQNPSRTRLFSPAP